MGTLVAIESTHSNKRIAKNTLMLYFRMLITMVVALYTSRVILQVLGASDYGLNNVVAGFVSLFTFINSTLATGTQRFMTYSIGAKDDEKLRKVFATALTLHLGFAFLLFIFLETAGLWFLQNKLSMPAGREIAAFWVYQFAVFSTMAQIVQVPYNAALAAHEKFNIYAYMSIYDVVMKLLIVFLIQIASFDKLIFYATLYTTVSLSSTLIYNIYCRKNFVECRSTIKGCFDKSLCKEIGTFSGWNIMGCIAVLASNQGVNILMNMFLGTLVNAARGISVQVTGVINQLVSNFLVAVNPQIIKLYAEKKYDEMFSLAMNASKFGAALMLWVCVPLIAEMNYVLTLWLGNIPEHTVVFSKYALAQAIIMATSRPLVTILHATGKMKLPNLIDGSILLLILPATYIMLKCNVDIDLIAGINIFPWICELITCICLVKILVKINTFSYFSRVIAKLIIIFVIAFFTACFIQNRMPESFIRLISVIVGSSVILFISAYYILFDKDARSKIIFIIKKRITRG